MRLGAQVWENGGLYATFSEALLRRALRIDDQHRAEVSVHILLSLRRLVVDGESRRLFVVAVWLAVVSWLASHGFGKLIVQGRV